MSLLIDFLSTVSLFGIWPRFVEPRLLKRTDLGWKLPPHGRHLAGLKIVHLSDLHFHRQVSQKFLDKITRQVEGIRPDVIVFTGDFICYSHLEDRERLHTFLSRFEAPHGCYCSFGNHDYSHYVSMSREGVYDMIPPPNPVRGVLRGIRTLFSPKTRGYQIAERVAHLPPHQELLELLAKTSFQILENRTITLPLGLNLTGLGDLALGQCYPEQAYRDYQHDYPGIALSHNPDTVPLLVDFPGEWILAGHTHGEQIHFPWPGWARKVSRKLARLENSEYTRGLIEVGEKKLYVNRGLGCHKPFRLFSPPELCVIQFYD